MAYGKRSLALLCVTVLLPCVLAGTNSSALNVTSKSNTSTVAVSRLSPMLLASLSKSNRTRANYTITPLSSKIKLPKFGSKVQNLSLNGSSNSTEAKEKFANLTLSANSGLNVTSLKNISQRFNSSRLERLTSKHSLFSLASTGVSSNKTVSPKVNRDSSVNVTLVDLKNVTGLTNNKTKTIEKRAIQEQLSNLTDRASSALQTLPSLLSNATNNVTSWAMRLIGLGNNSSFNATSGKIRRSIMKTADLETSDNSTSKNKSSEMDDDEKKDNSEEIDDEKERSAVTKSNQSQLDLDVIVIKRETNKNKFNVSASIKHKNNSSSAKNLTSSEFNHNSANLTANETVASSNVSRSNSSQNIKENEDSIDSHNNRTRRQVDAGLDGRSRNNGAPAQWMQMSATTPSPYPTPAPVYGPAPVNAAYGYMVSAPYNPMVPSYQSTPVTVYGPPSDPIAYAPLAPASYAQAAPSYQPAQVYPQPPAAASYAAPTSAYVMVSPAPVYYSTPAPFAQAYPQSESYYTAPPPTYSTGTPYVPQYPNGPYSPQQSPASYPSQAYGSVPVHPSATVSPWF